jgi:voltage-gated potassium channel
MKWAHQYRFELFLGTQLLILFGSLLVPAEPFHRYLLPALFVLNTLAGLILVSRKKRLFWFLSGLTILGFLTVGLKLFSALSSEEMFIRYSIYFIFHMIVTLEIIGQVWNATIVNKNAIIGLMSGYISLGFVTFFICAIIEFAHPGSFKGVFLDGTGGAARLEGMLYYSFVTLLTIGYGDIVPVSPLAQKASVLTGLLGQFYTVIITAVIVSKYILHSREN